MEVSGCSGTSSIGTDNCSLGLSVVLSMVSYKNTYLTIENYGIHVIQGSRNLNYSSSKRLWSRNLDDF